MKGKISKIKDTKGELALPITTVEAVYMGDGTTKLSDEIKDVLKCEVFDDEGITVEISSVVEEIDGIKKDISEINSSLDNIENEKATKQEVDVERKRIDNINSSLDTKANKSEVDNDINGLDVKIAENKSLTDSEISKLEEITNTWETFKASGGEIGGNVKFNNNNIEITDNIIQSNLSELALNDNNNYGYATVLLKNKGQGIGEFTAREGQNIDLGSPNIGFQNVYIQGLSIHTNGYTKLPNGLIMQWGEVQFSDIGHEGIQSFTKSINFPIEFPNAILVSVVTPQTNHYDTGKIKTCVVRYDMSGQSALTVCINVESPGAWHTNVKYIAYGC